MTPENVFRLYRAYKFFYTSAAPNAEFEKFRNIPLPALADQNDRAFFHRIAQKLDEPTIHALYTLGFFMNPHVHVSVLATPEWFTHAMVFASRQQNGDTIVQHDFYELRKRLTGDTDTLDTWLYGEVFPNGHRASMPGCLQDLIRGDIALDLACMLLLIPQPTLHFDWVNDMELESDDSDLGSAPWIARLHIADMLLRLKRPTWRLESRRLATEFWQGLGYLSLAPRPTQSHEPALF